MLFGHHLRQLLYLQIDLLYLLLRLLPLYFFLYVLHLPVTHLLSVFALLAFAATIALHTAIIALAIFFEAV